MTTALPLQTATVARPRDGKAASRGGTSRALFDSAMKDLVYVGMTLAFFWIAWAYAKSLDHL